MHSGFNGSTVMHLTLWQYIPFYELDGWPVNSSSANNMQLYANCTLISYFNFIKILLIKSSKSTKANQTNKFQLSIKILKIQDFFFFNFKFLIAYLVETFVTSKININKTQQHESHLVIEGP